MNEHIRKAYQHKEPEKDTSQEDRLSQADPETLTAQQRIRLAYIKLKVERDMKEEQVNGKK